jgi:hypothetical protein
MLQRIVVGIIAAIVGGAIGRGIVLAFGLDAKVARVIRAAASSANVKAIAWVITGLFGIAGVLSWELLHVSERVEAIFPLQRPALGSLPFVNFISEVDKNPASQINIQMSVELRNTNDFPVKYAAHLDGEVNGKEPATPDLNFEGFIPPNQTRYLTYNKIYDVPHGPIHSGGAYLEGMLHYDVSYYAAPAGQPRRRTSRRVLFSSRQAAQDRPVGTVIQENLIVRFSDELEE